MTTMQIEAQATTEATLAAWIDPVCTEVDVAEITLNGGTGAADGNGSGGLS